MIGEVGMGGQRRTTAHAMPCHAMPQVLDLGRRTDFCAQCAHAHAGVDDFGRSIGIQLLQLQSLLHFTCGEFQSVRREDNSFLPSFERVSRQK
jgi:hypothetical protein